MSDVGVVVVTYNAMPWLPRCLESVSQYETVVVDHGSSDDSVEVATRSGARVVQQENRGVAAGWNRGMRELVDKRYFLLLNSDAWALGDAVERLRSFADEHPRAAVVGPKLLNPDGSLQRSVRGFPTTWRLATEFFFLRKLAPRSRLLNELYASGFAHDEARVVEWVTGPAMLVRRDSVDQVGGVDESFFMFNEESDWQYRMRAAGWEVWFCPEAEVVHVGGVSTQWAWFPALVRSHVGFIRKHQGDRAAAGTSAMLLAALALRGVVFRGERGRNYRAAARSLLR